MDRAIPKSKARKASVAIGVAMFRDYVAMTKPRITLLVVLTTLAGFYMGAVGSLDIMLLLHTMIGTGVVVASANTLNQLWADHTGQKLEAIRNDTERDYFMSAPHAKEYGIVDEILTQKKKQE